MIYFNIFKNINKIYIKKMAIALIKSRNFFIKILSINIKINVKFIRYSNVESTINL